MADGREPVMTENCACPRRAHFWVPVQGGWKDGLKRPSFGQGPKVMSRGHCPTPCEGCTNDMPCHTFEQIFGRPEDA